MQRNHTDYADLNWSDIGDGVREAVVRLEKGDSAWHPGSTKRSLYGPSKVTYTRYADGGITGYVEDLD